MLRIAFMPRCSPLLGLYDRAGSRADRASPGHSPQRMPRHGECAAARDARQPSPSRGRQPTKSPSPMPAIPPITSTRPEACGSRPTRAAPTGSGRLPDVVTMNRAHSTHYTLFPDPRIPHVLHGWGENGAAGQDLERIGDVLIRNVTTDIRRYFGDNSGTDMIKDGNSIFIFEVAGLCIGHLGHLHVKLDDSHFAAIGRLDILMVPIDGTYTMSLDGISEITRAPARLRGAADAPLRDAAGGFHAADRQAFRDRPAQRTHTADFARDAADGADRDHSRRDLRARVPKSVLLRGFGHQQQGDTRHDRRENHEVRQRDRTPRSA